MKTKMRHIKTAALGWLERWMRKSATTAAMRSSAQGMGRMERREYGGQGDDASFMGRRKDDHVGGEGG